MLSKDERRKKLSLLMKGDRNPMKRPEVREKNRIASIEKWKRPEYRERQSLARRNRKDSKETIERRVKSVKKTRGTIDGRLKTYALAQKHKEYWEKNKEEMTAKIRESQSSKEFRRKRSKIVKELWKDPAYRNKQMKTKNNPIFKIKHSLATAAAMDDYKIKKKCSKSGKKLKGRKGKKLTENAKQKLRVSRSYQKFPKKDSSIEIKMHSLLKNINLKFVKHKRINIEHAYQCDIFIKDYNLVIECDGNYWHNFPNGAKIDKIRNKEMIERGYRVLRLWESEINSMDKKELLNRINKCIK